MPVSPSGLPPACAAAVVPARRYYDRRHLHGSGSPAEGVRGKAVAAERRETQSATHTRLWSDFGGYLFPYLRLVKAITHCSRNHFALSRNRGVTASLQL